MNKKVMALAIAGAFAAPTAAFAQSSNVQIYGTIYSEYAYAHQGNAVAGGTLVNADALQAPGSAIGFKGEEDLGGGMSAWFQCENTANPLGAGAFAGGGVWCGRNSAIGVKGSWGNAFVGNWDTPMKRTAAVNNFAVDTGVWGASGLLMGGSASFNSRATPTAWARRSNATMFYDSPNWSGFSVSGAVSTPSTAGEIGSTTNVTGAKSRLWSINGTYVNGPLTISLAYENHSNYFPSGATIAGNDNAYVLSGKYQFGPVVVGALYTKQKYETTLVTNADVSAYQIYANWAIAGPHVLQGAYIKANDTKGTFGAAGVGTIMGNRVYNAGGGATGGNQWQVEYQYWMSKRTRLSLGYVRLQNDTNANYNILGFTVPAPGSNQDAVAASVKTTF